ncbi:MULTISPECIES: DNA-J related domain-containing protein [unclassified Thioalkalivibrio]|uniref:DNA-J related domain-containing protein n=1 Tax=unclassified Thioalkalivibrio TaxID=2621013 RepID=UPI00037607AC|nr:MULTISPECIES: DNA-J related domain-containing protein [unclassified Thioalkalivibrio]
MSEAGGTAGSPVDAALLERVLEYLRARSSGMTEHTLIAQLREAGIEPFAGARLQEPLSLFQTHFLLFHCLYRLRDRLAGEGEWLRIHCLDIGIESMPHTPGSSGAWGGAMPALQDPLRAYYLDLDRLDSMDAAAVETLLGEFWMRLGRDQKREQALAVLELADPVDAAAIQRQYRRMAQRHHPDRGGDTATLQRINAARWILLGGA